MLLWRKHPNGGCVAAVAINDDVERICARGWITVKGHRASISEVLGEEELTGMTALLIRFDRPYPDRHP